MKTVPLGDVLVDIKPGFASRDNLETGVFQFRMHNFTRESALDLTKRRRVNATARQLEMQSVRAGDVLFNSTNSPELVGKSALIPDLDEPAVFSNHFMRLRTDPAHLDPGYLAHFLRKQFGDGVFRAMAKAWVNQATVGRDRLEGLTIPLPDLTEQRRIAAILDHADVLRAKHRQVLAHFDSLTLSVFHNMFGDPVENPHGYAVRPLAEWVEDGRPITYGILKPGPDVADGVPYIRVADMQGGGVNVKSLRRTSVEISSSYRRSLLRSGDLLMSIRGHVGRFAHIPAELEGANITQDSARLSIADPAASAYVRAAMESPALQRWMARHTKGVAVRGLNIGDLRQVPIPAVPEDQQQRFAARVQQIEAHREATRGALRMDDELFACLQSRAFRGEL